MGRVSTLFMKNSVILTLHLLLVDCVRNAKPVYPEISDPGISKRNADNLFKNFEQDIHDGKIGPAKRPKNVILFVGDGMSISTITGARYMKAQLLGLAAGEARLDWESWPSVALVATHSANRMTTDSASSATAFLCGVKTAQDVLGIAGISDCCICRDPNSATFVYSSFIYAQKAGLSTGLVTTTGVTHATPAAAYAHSFSRDWEAVSQHSPDSDRITCPDIALQLLTNGINFTVVLGGGYDKFYQTPDSHTPPTNGRRTDGRNLLKEWKQEQENLNRRYKLIFDRTALLNLNASDTDYLLGLFSPGDMDYNIQRTDQPSLSQMTKTAIKILSQNPKGFLLLVEGGRIDHAHHDNMAKLALTDTFAMEEAVTVAVNDTDAEETLILLTADHSHGYGILGYATRDQNILDVENTQKGEDGLTYLISSYFSGPGAEINKSRGDPFKKDRLSDTALQQALVPLKSGTHAGEDVALYTTGTMNQLFHGAIDNTFIAFGTRYALCLEPYENAPHCKQSGNNKSGMNASKLTILILLLLSAASWITV